MSYKLLSLFDGSGGFPLAGSFCGIEPVAASEVEPYPIAVTKSRFPNMKHLGSVTDINGAEVEPVDVITFGSPCFPAGTLVLTKKGYEPIEDIRVGDEVFTHKGNWKPVSAIGYKYSKTVKMKGNHYGLIATPNHPFYSAEQGEEWNGGRHIRTLKNIGEWTPAEEMQGKRWAVPNCISGLKIPNIEQTSAKQNTPPEINADLMYIIGRYLGDGWLRNGQRPNRPEGQTWGQIFICANTEKADYLEERMHKVFDGISTISRFSERTVEKFRVSDQALCGWILNNFGCMADGKTIPAWAYCMSGDMREALLRGYLDSDGYHFKESSWKAATVSKRLAHGIRLLGETLGYSATVHFVNTEKKTTIEGRTVNQKPWYQVVLAGEKRRTSIKEEIHTWYKCRSVEPHSDEQKVYNITVDDDHSYVVEGFVVHNCQDLSVAGKRAGLKHEENGDDETTRSGLFMEAIRIIKEMRRVTNGKYPRFAVWENVPGAFSSNKGEDFRTVLEELIKVVEPGAVMPPVPKNGWPYADCYVGDGWSLAYRVFDAQYWGVPQRRRRIYLVADFRGERAHEVLFKREGLRGYFETGRTPWESTSDHAEGSSGADDREGETYCIDHAITTGGNCTAQGSCIYEDIAATLKASGTHAATYLIENHPADSRVNIDKGIGINGDIAATLDASYYKGCGMRQGVEREVVVEPLVYESHPMDSRTKEIKDGVSPTVSVKWHKGSADTPLVMEPTTYDGANITSSFNASNPQPGDPCHTLSTDSRNYVVIPDRPAVGYAMQAIGEYADKDLASSLKQRDYKDATDLVVENDPQYVDTTHADDVVRLDDKTAPLQARDYKGGKLVQVRYIVRRLTPTECARLQGFPDAWGHHDKKETLTDEEYQFWLDVRNTHAAINGKQIKDYTKDQMLTWYNKLHTDSAEYKMWGNGIALPCALYVMQGIAEVLEEEELPEYLR